MQGFVIAIDGPVASGKGTIAPLLAQKLNAFYMNTGALFRMLALYSKRNNSPVDEATLLGVIAKISLDLDEDKAFLDGEDVSSEIYHSDISELSAQIAAISAVHEQVIVREREIAEEKMQEGKIVILEGRNIGTAVFPDAALKLYLTASTEKRAQRRYEQAKQRGEEVSFEEVLRDTKVRDERDLSRSFYPLVHEPEKYGYLTIDNSDFTEGQTFEVIVQELEKRRLIV